MGAAGGTVETTGAFNNKVEPKEQFMKPKSLISDSTSRGHPVAPRLSPVKVDKAPIFFPLLIARGQRPRSVPMERPLNADLPNERTHLEGAKPPIYREDPTFSPSIFAKRTHSLQFPPRLRQSLSVAHKNPRIFKRVAL